MKKNHYEKEPVFDYFQHQSKEKTPSYRLNHHGHVSHATTPTLFLHNLPEKSHCSVETMATNGDYPRQYMTLHNLSLTTGFGLAGITATNLSKPSCRYVPKISDAYINQVVTLLNVRLQSFTTPETLSSLFKLHDWREQASRLPLDALTSIEITPRNRLRKGVMSRCLLIELHCDQKKLPEAAEAYLLGLLLHQLFYFYAPLNTETQTRITLNPLGKTMNWNQHEYIG